MSYIPKMVSLNVQDATWIAQNQINLSHFLRDSIEICKEVDARSCKPVVQRLRMVNTRLNDLLAAYQMDTAVIKERVQ